MEYAAGLSSFGVNHYFVYRNKWGRLVSADVKQLQFRSVFPLWPVSYFSLCICIFNDAERTYNDNDTDVRQIAD